MVMQIGLDGYALDALVKLQGEKFLLQISQATAENFARRHIKALANDSVLADFRKRVREISEKVVEETVNGKIVVNAAVLQRVRTAVAETVDKAVDDTIRETLGLTEKMLEQRFEVITMKAMKTVRQAADKLEKQVDDSVAEIEQKVATTVEAKIIARFEDLVEREVERRITSRMILAGKEGW